MTRLYNDPAFFMEDMLVGFLDAHASRVIGVDGGVVRAQAPRAGKVAVVVGGGSGHYPAFAGLVGSGFADGAIVGNIFTSPSADDAYSVAANAENGGGVILTAGNYAGDVMHFTEAARQLREDGIAAEVLFVTDDIASAPASEAHKRRGIAGDFVVFKLMSAAAEEGLPLSEVLAVGRAANDATRTLGVAFAGCTLPGANEPLFSVDKGHMAIGLGIHGEPGIQDVLTPTAANLADTLVQGLLSELALGRGDRVATILNGLGGTKYEELFVVWGRVSQLLREAGLSVIEPEVGELVTSLDMAGCSLTITKLDDQLERLWAAAADTPAYKKGSIASSPLSKRAVGTRTHSVVRTVDLVSPAAQSAALSALHGLARMKAVLLESEGRLGALDAIAGDGDHGRGMVKGITAAVATAELSAQNGEGVGELLESAGSAWAAKAGGTSGALWGAALRRMGEALGNSFDTLDGAAIRLALHAGFDAMQSLGKAQRGDKTMLDAFGPFLDSLDREATADTDFLTALHSSSADANAAATATASMSPKIGRARPLAEKSIGTPDPGAISLALCIETVLESFSSTEEK
ncbi:MAG: dihydroxyacetone kinase family protein [Actinomycetales bacterium]|nr:dihydroxyacetone kinase family protein [Actinomycetales bacterium]